MVWGCSAPRARINLAARGRRRQLLAIASDMHLPGVDHKPPEIGFMPDLEPSTLK